MRENYSLKRKFIHFLKKYTVEEFNTAIEWLYKMIINFNFNCE